MLEYADPAEPAELGVASESEDRKAGRVAGDRYELDTEKER